MNNLLKGGFIFTGGVVGGFVICGVVIGKAVIKSDMFRMAIKDKISNEVGSFLYGKRGRTKTTHYNGVSYKKYSDIRHEYYNSIDDIRFATRQEAECVLYHVEDILDNYGSVSVSDLFDLCGLTTDFRNNSFGWTDLHDMRKATIVRRRYGGYQIIFPKTVALL